MGRDGKGMLGVGCSPRSVSARERWAEQGPKTADR